MSSSCPQYLSLTTTRTVNFKNAVDATTSRTGNQGYAGSSIDLAHHPRAMSATHHRSLSPRSDPLRLVMNDEEDFASLSVSGNDEKETTATELFSNGGSSTISSTASPSLSPKRNVFSSHMSVEIVPKKERIAPILNRNESFNGSSSGSSENDDPLKNSRFHNGERTSSEESMDRHGESCCEIFEDDDDHYESKLLGTTTTYSNTSSFQTPPSLSTFVSNSREVYKRIMRPDMNAPFVVFIMLLIIVVTGVLTLMNINNKSLHPINNNSDQRSTQIFTTNLQNSVNTLSQLKDAFNRADMVNPTNSTFAFSTFLSVASNEKVAFDYTVGVVTLFQSVISNTKTNYPFVVVVVPPRINDAKGLTESVVVKRTLSVITDIQQSLRPEELSRMRFVIASYISNPTEGKHAIANNVENRYIDTFNKLHMWKLDEFNFKRIIYFDADVIVLKPQIDTLFQCGHFCAVSDLCIPEFFNGGLMVLEPKEETYRDMTEKIRQPEYKSYDGGEQGFINRYFDFNINSTAWPLRAQALGYKQHQQERSTINLNGNFEELAQKVPSSVYRLPFNFNVQSQLALLSSIGWHKFASTAVDDGSIALHLVFPVKPWTFIGYPMLSPSYMWQTYFRKTALYRIIPWELLLLNFSLCCLAVIIISKQVGKIELPTLLLSNLFGNMIEDHVKHFKDGTESWKSFLFFNFMPPLAVIFSCLVSAYVYLALLLIQQYDPHMIWAMMIVTSGSITAIILGLYTNVLSHATFLHFSKRFFTLKIGQNYNSKKYFFWLVGTLAFGTIGCSSVFIFCMYTIGLFVLQIVYASLILLAFLLLLYLKVLQPISHLTIIRTLKNLTKEGEKNSFFKNKLDV
ncbi:hypothetical protein C9374_014183 [Naegleria lovaniensis]|uniref:Glycosyltransferase n=1 Tax=Naegleria lovaniensis TaxID=51637 RepID=A0AA88H273_NAELO|nr:uncharacterized protein C9374_014183 [Naegleria lovaniensis]KAG2389623.1 hypothetical protein C9374_014183 [Naegleria lovaniensis]